MKSSLWFSISAIMAIVLPAALTQAATFEFTFSLADDATGTPVSGSFLLEEALPYRYRRLYR